MVRFMEDDEMPIECQGTMCVAFSVGNVLVTPSAVYNSGMYDQRTDGCRLDRINYEN